MGLNFAALATAASPGAALLAAAAAASRISEKKEAPVGSRPPLSGAAAGQVAAEDPQSKRREAMKQIATSRGLAGVAHSCLASQTGPRAVLLHVL